MSGQVLNPSHESLEMDVEELQLAKRQGSSSRQLQAAGGGILADSFGLRQLSDPGPGRRLRRDIQLQAQVRYYQLRRRRPGAALKHGCTSTI